MKDDASYVYCREAVERLAKRHTSSGHWDIVTARPQASSPLPPPTRHSPQRSPPHFLPHSPPCSPPRSPPCSTQSPPTQSPVFLGRPVWRSGWRRSDCDSTPEDHGFESQPAPHIGGGEGDKGALLGQATPVWDRICISKKPTAVASAAADRSRCHSLSGCMWRDINN